MKWIGQHIWDLISRFRSDVYLDKVASDAVESAPDTDTTLALKDGKIVRTAAGLGGGNITVKDNSGQTFLAVTEITHYGDDTDMKLYANGTGKVIVDHHGRLNFANNFSILNDPIDGTGTPSALGTWWVGAPQNLDGYNFFAGPWGGFNNKQATQASTLQWSSNTCGNFLIDGNASKIKVTVEGPTIGNASYSNILGSHTLQVTDDTTAPHSSGNGITIAITNFDQDETIDKKKAKVTVTLDLDNSNLIYEEGFYTGSQYYHKVKIEQLDSNDVVIAGVNAYESDPFFYDHNNISPTASDPTVTLTSSTTKQLSNIKYYATATYTTDSTNHSNLTRDTGYNAKGYVNVNPDPEGSSGLGINSVLDALTGDSGDTNDNSNAHTVTHTVASNYFKTNFTQGFKLKVEGGLSGDSGFSNTVNDSNSRNFHTYSSNNTQNVETHKSENYRLSENEEAAWKLESTDDNVGTWRTRCVGFTSGGTINATDYSSWGLNSNDQHLLQGYFNGAFRLIHPEDSGVGTIAAYPSHTWSSPGNGTYSFIRFFGPYNEDIQNGNIYINGLHKNTFTAQHAAGNIEIDMMVPGTGNTKKGVWVPLINAYDPSVENYGCWKNKNAQGGTNDYYYDIKFGVSFKVIIFRVKFNESFTGDIKNITWYPNSYANG